ncbi:MAG TPA: RDD family protein [Cellvibrio sp.]|nr:RDD family protein [Cellvibrio sp.]
MNTTTIINYSTPSLLRRFAAMTYDSLLIMSISILYGAIVTGTNVAINGIPATGERVTWGAFGVIVFIGWILTIAVFFCYFWHKTGQTLGMKTWRMKMVTSTSLAPPSYPQCFIRCLCAPLSLLLLGIGYWLMYANPERQTLHDKLSKTRIVLLSKENK